ESERQARQAIRRARRENPGATIVVTGCAAQIDAARFAAMPEVDHVIGNAEKMKAETFAALARGPLPARVVVNDIMSVRETASHMVEGFEGRARAFVEVQHGCDHRCTFCIIPYGRGPSRSAPVADIVAQAERLVAAGTNELVLTGVDLTAYGADLPGTPTLGRMVRRLLDGVPALARLRLSSIDVAEVDDELLHLIVSEPRLMPHLHLSLQAGDDMILKRMKRRHSRSQAIDFCARVRAERPEIVFGADLIAGFPTETDAMFENTLAMVADAGLTWLHVFPYSTRPGTPAARMPALPGAMVRERARRLRAAGNAARDRFLATCVGATEDVLVEQPGLGRTPRYAHVVLTDPAGTPVAATGAVVPARITAADEGRLHGIVG
ncbi:MAG: tRNA (N(6)-L-threonylcarbamoyladenosine(37)-C(2))-methylthiotransferase MtaB, partial [Alphaproteobacteria bacterium]|nr:tRNA (N(6)-L-threonylcarbamoyladenosine(37)-C(2))-methylthiotransferase MtaB [Alphaproteobacteria bacterium]